MAPLFQRALGAAWARLAPPVRAFHAGPATRFAGEAQVARGTHAVARALAGAFGFPPDGAAVPVTVTVERTAEGHERWHRRFGRHAMTTTLAPAGAARVRERIGPASFDLALDVDADGALSLAVAAGRFCGVPLPRPLLPISDAREADGGDGRFAFDIAVRLRLVGPMIRYRGWLVPAD
ncbi:MAG: DUF4166 domain-containing protein [Pseudomonadota bacterium]